MPSQPKKNRIWLSIAGALLLIIILALVGFGIAIGVAIVNDIFGHPVHTL
jgi:hypothetical protein